jgi:ubiquinone/menaquinone biosynthesis C-methylase UbiE
MLKHVHKKSSVFDAPGSMEGWANWYDIFTTLFTLGQERKGRQAILDVAKAKSGERILEVGCGTGSLSLLAKDRAGAQSQVCGIDVAPDMVESAKRKAIKAGLDVQFQLGRIEDIPFADNHFDLVLSSFMLHHVPGDDAKKQGMKEIFRVLKSGGRYLIVDIAPAKSPFLYGIINGVFGQKSFEYNLQDYIPMLEQAGFVDVGILPTKSKFFDYLFGRRP